MKPHTGPLFHYCCDHSNAKIEADNGILRPGITGFLWLTDLYPPIRAALGLTSTILDCDRMTNCWQVDEPTQAVRWVAVRKHMPDLAVELESAPGAAPMHWWVSAIPLKATAVLGADS